MRLWDESKCKRDELGRFACKDYETSEKGCYMKKTKQILKVDIDFLAGPLSLYDILEDFDLQPVIDSDKELIDLDNKMSQMYDSYYEFNTHDVACWFDEERFFAEKNKMLSLVERFKKRLIEIGGDSFEIEDKITPMYDRNK